MNIRFKTFKLCIVNVNLVSNILNKNLLKFDKSIVLDFDSYTFIFENFFLH